MMYSFTPDFGGSFLLRAFVIIVLGGLESFAGVAVRVAQRVLAMAAAGKVHCQVATRPLAQVNEVLEELRHGQVSGRIALLPRQ